jgi:hypothetical protein
MHALLLAAAPRRYGNEPLAFYSATATVIPVLFLALIYQSRVSQSAPPWLRYTATFLGTLFAFTGEVFSLRVLAHGYVVTNNLETGIVWSLIVLGVAVALDPLIVTRNAIMDWLPGSKDSKGRHRQRVVVASTIAIVLLAFWAFVMDNVFRGFP